MGQGVLDATNTEVNKANTKLVSLMEPLIYGGRRGHKQASKYQHNIISGTDKYCEKSRAE